MRVGDYRVLPARSVSVLLNALTVVFLSTAILLLCLHFVPYPKAKAFFDSRVAPHLAGSHQNPFSEQAYHRLTTRLLLVAGIFGFWGITLLLLKRKLECFLVALPSEWAQTHVSLFDELRKNTETRLEVAAVLIVTAVGVLLRIWHLKRAVRFDEAWTYLEFASKPLVVGLSNYRAPNNHLLNTLLVHFSTRLFGNSLFGLRFPALIAGSLVIIATWLVTRALYGSGAGILASGLVAALPTFIEFSVNARGYGLQWLSVLGMFWLGQVLLRKPSLRIGWLGLVLVSIFGMYSIPTTVIPLAGVFAWMLVSSGVNGTSEDLKGTSKKVALAGLAIGMISALLYVPPLLVRGVGAVAANDVVSWQQPEFVGGLKNVAQCARVQWTEGVPRGIVFILCLGFILGMVLHRRIRNGEFSRDPVIITIALWTSAGAFVWARHIFAFPRVWSYLLLSAVMTASAGLSIVAAYLGRSKSAQVVIASLAAIAFAAVIGIGVVKQRALFTTNETGTIIDADQIVDSLPSDLRPGDSLISNAIIEYEFLRRNPQLYKSLSTTKDGQHVVAVVVKSTGTNEVCKPEDRLALMSAQDVADPGILASQIDLTAYTPLQIQSKFLSSTVYSLDRKGQ